MYPTRRTLAMRLAHPWLRLLLLLLARFFAPKFCISGTANVPRRGAVLLTPNHISDCDPPFVHAASPRFLWFMGKRELFDRPILGKLIPFFGAFPINNHDGDRAALRHAGELLVNGGAVVVFPEGQLSQSGELEPVLPGAVMLAWKSGVPIVPVGVWNTPRVVPYASLVPRPTLERVAVHFGPAINFDDLHDLPKREARDAAADRLQNAIAEARAVAQRMVAG